MLGWLYIHIGLGRKGAFLFGFTTAVMLMLVFVGLLLVLWCKECLRVSGFSTAVGRCKGESPESEGALFSCMVQAVCLFRLLFVSLVWAGWSAGWFAVLTAYYRWWSWLFGVSMWVCLMCCGAALPTGVLMGILSCTKAWKARKDELYRLVDKGLDSKQ